MVCCASRYSAALSTTSSSSEAVSRDDHMNILSVAAGQTARPVLRPFSQADDGCLGKVVCWKQEKALRKDVDEEQLSCVRSAVGEKLTRSPRNSKLHIQRRKLSAE